MRTELDALDIDLLDTMRDNPRAGVLELSRLLKVARGTVQARLDRLERPERCRNAGPPTVFASRLAFSPSGPPQPYRLLTS